MTSPSGTPKFRRSARASSLELSEIVQITEAAKARRAEGHDVLSFGTGEPDFLTPDHVIEATYRAMKDEKIWYTPTQGDPALRQAICDDAARQSGFTATPDQVIVSTGAKQTLFNAFIATLDPGDEVIVPAPYWSSYADIIGFVGGTVVPVACSEHDEFALTPAGLEAAITPRTRWLLLNSPGNPSGKLYSKEELQALAEVLRKHPHVWIMSDEIYQHIAYEPFTSFRVAAPDLNDRTLVVNGISKSYAMIGWRIGWGIGPAELVRAMTAAQGQSTSCASSVSQLAAIAALEGPQNILTQRCAAFQERRDVLVSALNNAPLLSCKNPGGAFYVFPSCKETIGKTTPGGQTLKSDADFCEYLLNEFDLAVVPGRAFGTPGYFRMSYAYSMDEIAAGCGRIIEAVKAME